jgi:hypothetical protein
MIESRVPKDIRNYRTKLIAGLDFRQIMCVVGALATDAVLKFVVFPLIGDVSVDSLTLIFGFIDIPILAFGWLRPDDLPLEIYIRDVVIRNFLAPRKRKLKRVIYTYPQPKYTDKQRKESDAKVAAEVKKHPEYKAYM